MPRNGLLGILATLSVLAVPACGNSGGLATAPEARLGAATVSQSGPGFHCRSDGVA